MSFDLHVDGVRVAGTPMTATGARLELPLEASAELHRHVVQLGRTHGLALTAVLQDLVADLEARMSAAERGLRAEFGAVQRMHEAAVACWREEQACHATTADALAAVLAELERRDRRSGRKPSREAAKAHKALDRYLLDRA